MLVAVAVLLAVVDAVYLKSEGVTGVTFLSVNFGVGVAPFIVCFAVVSGFFASSSLFLSHAAAKTINTNNIIKRNIRQSHFLKFNILTPTINSCSNYNI